MTTNQTPLEQIQADVAEFHVDVKTTTEDRAVARANYADAITMVLSSEMDSVIRDYIAEQWELHGVIPSAHDALREICDQLAVESIRSATNEELEL